jgi:hypothetical protein
MLHQIFKLMFADETAGDAYNKILDNVINNVNVKLKK